MASDDVDRAIAAARRRAWRDGALCGIPCLAAVPRLYAKSTEFEISLPINLIGDDRA